MTARKAMSGWREATLKDLVFFQRGFDITKAEQKPGNVPVVSSSGIKSFHSTAKVPGPGVVIGRKGSLGTVHYVDCPYWPHDTTLWSKDLKGNVPKYVYYYLHMMGLKRFDVGSSNPTLNRNHIHELPILLPKEEIQERIVALLNKYDVLIENNRRRIQLLEESARLLYKEWFVRLRFPGHEHVKVVDGVPEGWERSPLGDAFTLQRGFDLPVKKRKPGGTPIYASTGVTGYHNAPKVKAPGVVTGRSGSLGHVMYVQEDFWPLNTTLWVKQFKTVDPFYAYFVLEGLQLQRLNGGAAVPTLNRNDVHPIEILIPDGTILGLFTDSVEPLFAQQKMLTEYNTKLSEARDLLLPRLMNGEVAV